MWRAHSCVLRSQSCEPAFLTVRRGNFRRQAQKPPKWLSTRTRELVLVAANIVVSRIAGDIIHVRAPSKGSAIPDLPLI